MYSTLYRMFYPKSANLPPRTDGWYGIGKSTSHSPPPDNPTINQFTVNIDDTILQDLRHRLDNSRFFESIEGTDFRYGFNSKTLHQVVDYWKTKYDWRKWENELNRYDQYVTQIEGLNIHYVHVKPKNPTSGTVIPLLAIHGWPGSYYEYYKSIPSLTGNDGGLSFELILPSIPGYGFSEAPHQEGFNMFSAARIFVKLMQRLGHERFLVHGGDWGSIIGKAIAVMYPENVLGLHMTLFMGASSEPQGIENNLRFLMAKYLPMLIFGDDEEKKLFDELKFQQMKWYEESGYSHIQSTKPDTVGTALTDSPIGLAAYIMEKFSTWTNRGNVQKPDGGLTEKFTMDELLTNVMIYWLSGNVTSSMRFYRENANPSAGVIMKTNFSMAPVTVPSGYAVLPHEIAKVPKFVAQMTLKNLIHYSVLPRGGHFGAFEEPHLVADDLKKFARIVLSNSN